MKLLEIFKDFKIIIKGKSFHSKYDADFEVIKKTNPKVITLQDLKEYIEDLQNKYPNHNFYLDHKYVNGKEYYIITRKKRMRMPNGSIKYVKERIPIYIDLKEQKFYIPQCYIKKQYKLACYVIMRVLGILGISTTKYIGMKK